MDFKEKIAELISTKSGLEKQQALSLLTTPPQGMGDYAFPCFVLAKEQKKNPAVVAVELGLKINAAFLEKTEAKGPYLNFFLSKGALSNSVLEEIFTPKKNVKGKAKNKKQKIMIEYSGPNTNKPLHVGHLRNNSLGLAISNLLEAQGNNVVKANIVNDRGVHICKSMLAYKLYGQGKTPASVKTKSDHFVGDMYVMYNELVKSDSSLEEKAAEMLKKWEKKDKETIALWKKMNEWAMSGMKETYKTFGSKFDVWFFESKMFEKQLWKKIVEEGLAKGIFKREDNGAIIAVLEPELPNKVLLRGDGTSLYATNDLGVTQEKFNKYKLDQSIWVVGSEQDLYFKQLFAIFKKLDRPWAEKCYHLSYGMVTLPTGRIKSREGTTADADDLIEEVKKIAVQEISKRYPKLNEKAKQKRALTITLAAIKFFLLKNDAKKELVFDPEKSVSFEGESGPYLQYTFARAKSILRKARTEKTKYAHKNFELLTHEKEKELITALSTFEASINRSISELSMHPICHALLSIAEKFNSFYHEVPVLKADDKKLLNARLSLVEATSILLKKGLGLLDIEAIEEM